MTLLHALCDEGVCGRRWLAALLDAGASPDAVAEPVDRLGMGARLATHRATVRSVVGTRVEVEVPDGTAPLRTPAELSEAIDAAKLAGRAAERARAVARALAEAEASVHGVAPHEVHFHELSRPRTVVTIVAAAAALEDLGVGPITTSPVAVGGGSVDIAHGRFPVPPPAVLYLLGGLPVEGGPREGELTTPSGAAWLAALAEPVEAIPRIRLLGHGRGVVEGPDDPRSLTVLLGEPAAP